MPIDYVTVFQISTQSPNWFFALAGGIPLIIGMVILWGRRRFGWKQPPWLFAIFFCAFGLFWLCTAGMSVLREDFQMKTAFQTGNFQVVEGVVTDFHPMPYEGHQDECFSVQDQRFCYSDYGVTSGFHNATSHGGPIQAGLPVRIAYVGNNILRLEIPRDRILAPAQSATILNSAQQGWQQRTESDPFDRHMNVAFLFTAVCWTLWWNLQWKLAMRFWTRTPNRPWVQYLFRTFFALVCGG